MFFSEYDVVALQETRSSAARPLGDMLAGTHVCYAVPSPPARHGVPGHGLAVYLRAAWAPYARHLAHPSSLVHSIILDLPSARFIITNVYLSPSLQTDAAFAALDSHYHALALTPPDIHVLGGDFNSALPPGDDRPLDHRGICHLPIPPRDIALTAAGDRPEELLAMCHTQRLVALTGRLQDISVSTSSAQGETRVDHVLMSAAHFHCATFHRVTLVPGSNHYPVEAEFALPCAPTPQQRVTAGLQQLPPVLRWSPDLQDEFEVEVAAAVPGILEACSEGDPTLAVDRLHAAVLHAGTSAGMRARQRHLLPAAPRARFHQRWFDAECRAARARLLPRADRDSPEARTALQEYRRLVRRKRRQHLAAGRAALRDADTNHRAWLLRFLHPTPTAVPPVPHHHMHAHFQQAFRGPGLQPVQGPPAPTGTGPLAEHLTEEAVQLAAAKLRGRAAPGYPGVPAQALRHPALAAPVSRILQAVACAPSQPLGLGMGLLTPAFKRKGDAMAPSQYRPLVVSSVLHKLYALCLLQALHVCLRREEARAALRSTAGFLPGRGPLFNCFALQHMAHHQQHVAKAPLYVVLVDVSGAYDSVDHNALHACLLDEFSLPLDLVAAIVGVYCQLQYTVQYAGGCGTPFPVGVGVKQGCPLSPVLYAMYVSGLNAHLAAHCPDAGFACTVQHTGVNIVLRVRDLFYADDLVLVEASSTPTTLQLSLDATVLFMTPRGQRLSIPKCVGTVFGRAQGAPLLELAVGADRVPVQQKARYLGLMYDEGATAATMAAHRTDIYASQFGLVVGGLRAAGSHRAYSVFDALYLLGVVAQAAGSYGCGLWGIFFCKVPPAGAPRGPVWGRRGFYALSDPLEVRRCRLLRKYLGLPRDTPGLCLLHELGLPPMVHSYVLQAVTLYNSLVNGGPLYQGLLRQNVYDGIVRNPGVRNWAAHLYAALTMVCPRESWRIRMLAADLQPLPVGVVRKGLRDYYNKMVTELKTVQPGGEGARQGDYFRTVGVHPLAETPVYLRRRFPFATVRECLRFRLGAHSLRLRLGRHVRPPLPRHARHCLRCAPRAVLDDECHCLFHCNHPVLSAARQRLAPILQGAASRSVAGLFTAAGAQSGPLRRVVEYVALCQRVVRAAARPSAPAPGPVPDLAADDSELMEASADESEELEEVAPGVYMDADHDFLYDCPSDDEELEECVD